MENHQAGKKTTLALRNFGLNAKDDQTEFDPGALPRLR